MNSEIQKDINIDSILWAQRIYMMAVNLDLKKFSSQISDEIINEISLHVSKEENFSFVDSVCLAEKVRNIISIYKNVSDYKIALKNLIK